MKHLSDYQRIEKAIQFIEKHFLKHPSLGDMAAHIGLSHYHFQRLFKRFAGISPFQFSQFLTKTYAKQCLDQTQNLLDASLELNLSSPSRLHDLFVTFEAITPGQYKSQGTGITIMYGFHPTPFGKCLIAITSKGICHLAFLDNDRRSAFLSLKKQWLNAELIENEKETRAVIDQIFHPVNRSQPFHLLLKGTNFQIKVWEALIRIPLGGITHYEQIAKQLGQSTATRAVANAIAKNSIAFLIPCHRVITKSAEIHNYRWGVTRKKIILGWEAGQAVKL